MKHRVIYEFEVDVEENDERNGSRKYTACCSQLSGCRVHASTEAGALDRIKDAIGIWIDFTNRQMDEFDVEDYM